MYFNIIFVLNFELFGNRSFCVKLNLRKKLIKGLCIIYQILRIELNIKILIAIEIAINLSVKQISTDSIPGLIDPPEKNSMMAHMCQHHLSQDRTTTTTEFWLCKSKFCSDEFLQST